MDVKKGFGIVAAAVFVAFGAIAFAEQLPVFSADGPDAQAYGAADHFPVGTGPTAFEKKYMVGSFSHFEDLYPTHTVTAAEHAWSFQRVPTTPEITYLSEGNRYTLKDYLAHVPVTGLLIAKDDQILFEGYQYGRTDRDRFTSESMAKSIVAMLIGVAVAEHKIGSTADVAGTYVPELNGADYGKITLRDLLHMSSGVTCQTGKKGFGTLADLKQDCKQSDPAGTRFRYSAEDSAVLGLVLGRAVNMPLARYLQETIWQEIGTESEATWTTDSAGRELPLLLF